MEEGTPSPASRPPLPHPPASKDNAFSSAIVHAYPSPLTYIVQVPKDQICRIPPKENGRLVEQHQAHLASLRKQRSLCLIFLLRFLCIFISIALPLILAALIFIIVVRPTAPIFNVDHIVMESKAQCEIFMDVTNPSIGMGYSIEKGDERGAMLSYKGKNLADGESPQLSLKAKELRRFKLVLHGVRKAALEEVEESLKGLKKAVQLRLTLSAPVRVEIWGLRLWRMKMKLDCDVRVKSSAKATKVLFQERKVSIGFW